MSRTSSRPSPAQRASGSGPKSRVNQLWRGSLGGVFSGILCISGLFVSLPLDAAETKVAPGTAATPAPQVNAAKVVPRDDDNQRGISPFWEKIAIGDRAAIGHDYASAHHYYLAALTSDPKNPIGHLRLAEVALRQNELAIAPDYLEAALRFSEGNLRSLAQAHILMAQYYELKNSVDAAIAAWTNYKNLAVQAEAEAQTVEAGALPPAVKIHVANAELRIQALTVRKEQVAAYEEVRKRIDSNVAAADRVTGKSASDGVTP